MCAEEEKRGKEKEEKRKEKEKEDQNRGCLCPRTCFSYAQWSFFEYIKNTVSRLSRSYSLLFAIKILMVRQFGAF